MKKQNNVTMESLLKEEIMKQTLLLRMAKMKSGYCHNPLFNLEELLEEMRMYAPQWP